MKPRVRGSRLPVVEAPCFGTEGQPLPSEPARGREQLIGAMFCLSGVPALIYQIAWQRILVLHSGVGPISVAIIVAAYMAGLGLGSLAGGLASRQLTPRAALFGYAALELAIAGFALASGTLYHTFLGREGTWLYRNLWQTSLTHFLALLPPTFLMGATLPVLVRALVHGGPAAPRTIGMLYGLNVLGAALGALLTPWVLIPYGGLLGAIRLGAVCNLLVGLGVLIVGCSRQKPAAGFEPAAPAGRSATIGQSARKPFRTLALLYGLSGFVAIALEIVWFRLIDVAAKATAFTFGTVLGIYLLGLAAGSLIGARRVARVEYPLARFLACQCGILAYVGVEIVLLAYVPPETWGYRWYFTYWGTYEPLGPSVRSWVGLVGLYVVLPFLLFGIPTGLMGYSFALLQRAVQDRRETSGLKVGALQFANIIGCTAGSLVIGLVLFAHLGTTGTLRFLIGLGGVFALLGMQEARSRGRFAAALLVLGMLAFLLPDSERLWRRLHGQGGGLAFFEEDETGVVALFPEATSAWRLSVNGKGQSLLPYGGIHSKLGALAATLHPAPERIAIIGLGSGDTAWAAACRLETRAVTVFEICPSQLRLLRRLHAENRFPLLDLFLDDPRITVVGGDGRRALASEARTYDLIEADAIRPNGAYSGNLYSLEFFQLCARRLKPGGLMCTWSPTPRVHDTFRQAFLHVLELDGGQILIGGNQPIDLDLLEWDRRLSSQPVAAYLGPEIVSECARSILKARSLPRRLVPPRWLNTDLFPRDEYQSPTFRKGFPDQRHREGVTVTSM